MKIDSAISYCLNKLSNISLTGYDVTNLNYLITKLFDYVITNNITELDVEIYNYANDAGWYIQLTTKNKSLDFDGEGRYDKYLRYFDPLEYYQDYDNNEYELDEVDDLLKWVFIDEVH